MRRVEHGWIAIGLFGVAMLTLAYLVLPIVMTVPLSLEPGPTLRFPPQSLSLHWYCEYLSSDLWITSTVLSFEVGICASFLSTVVGTLAAIGLARARSPLRDVCYLVLMSPIFLPNIVIAVAIYGMFSTLRLVGSPVGLILAHTILTLPFVVMNVRTAIAAAPPFVEDAAMSLGARPAGTLWQVTLPLVRMGIAAGAIFSFLVSFDEVVVAMFLSGTQAVTLPKRMLDGIFYDITPMLASVSVLLVAANIVLVTLAMTLRRSADVRRRPLLG